MEQRAEVERWRRLRRAVLSTPASSSAAPPTPHTAMVSQAPTPAAATTMDTVGTTPAAECGGADWAAFPEQWRWG